MSFATLLGIPDEDAAEDVGVLLAESDDVEVIGTMDSGDGVLDRLADEDLVEVVVLHEQLGPLPVLELARDVNHRFPQVGIVLVSEEQTAEMLRAAMTAGVRAAVAMPLSLEKLHEAIVEAGDWARSVRARLEAHDGRDRRSVSGRMMALAGAKGGVGTTTMAVHLALGLQHRQPERSVCLVDLDLQAGDVRALLDIEHRRGISDLVDVAGELTSRHLDETMYAHASGLRVLLPPRRGEDAEDVDTTVARQLLGGIRSRFDVVVVDVGTILTEAGAVALELADEAVVVATPDVVALRGANRLLRLWERVEARSEARILLNHAERDREVQPALVRRVVHAPLLETTVPAGFADLESATNTGVPDQVEGGVRDALDELVDELARAPEKAAEPAGAERPREGVVARRVAAESGQASVELIGMLPIIGLALLLVWQLVLTGLTVTYAQHAARAGAREAAVRGGGSADVVREVIEADVPEGWRDGLSVSSSPDDGSVSVGLEVPILAPGTDSPWKVSADARVMPEAAPGAKGDS